MKMILTVCAYRAMSLLWLSAALGVSSFSQAQDTASSSLPDAPGARLAIPAPYAESSASQQQPTPDPGAPAYRPRHFRGIISTLGTVPAGIVLPPQSSKDKFILASEDNFDLYSVVAVGVVAAEQLATDSTPEFHHGGPGYARYYWHAYANRTIENYAVEFLVPSLLHEDTRYYYLGRGGFGKRTGHAIKRAFVTRTDAGAATFNYSEIIGAGAAAGLSNLYYPSGQRTVGNTMEKWGINIAVDAGSFFAQEFYPDVLHALFHKKDKTTVNP